MDVKIEIATFMSHLSEYLEVSNDYIMTAVVGHRQMNLK